MANILAKNTFLRSLLAVWLLMVFTFSILPKKSLHDLIADHKDSPLTAAKCGGGQFSRSGFNCHIDNLVVESPFVDEGKPVEIPHNCQYLFRAWALPVEIAVPNLLKHSLRGPPTMA